MNVAIRPSNTLCLVVSLVVLAPLTIAAQSKAERRNQGVFPAPPELISYQRVAPLLDGIYEDVAAIQLSPLQLSATNPNGTSLDAIQQSLQISASYNALDALQNSTNENLFKANAAYQGSIIDQMTVLSAQLTNASIASSAAQNKLSTLQSATNPAASADSIAEAQATAASLAAQVTQLTAQMTALKAAQSSTSVASFTSTTPTTATLNAAGGAPTPVSKLGGGSTPLSPTVPSISGSGSTAQNGSPSLPPTRQMDTQIGLLWDRLMRLLSTIGEPDSEQDVQFELLRFYPSITYIDKQTIALRIEYGIACLSSDGRQPKILDVYPRTSPVNILNEKYKDNSFSLAAFFGFSAANASAAYNREHLQLTNSMAQSSYVTGFGAGSGTFGWILGKALGDDTIAIGQKEMYALAAVPNSCKIENDLQFSVFAKRVVWEGSAGKPLSEADKSSDGALRNVFTIKPEEVTNVEIREMRYSQSDGTLPVPVTITFDKPIDAQARVIVNGAVLSRSRDNFARGTAQTSGGTVNNIGLFESQVSALAPSSWSRTSENQITMLLDPKVYGSRFPEVVITSPQGDINVLDQQFDDLTVNGQGFTCGPITCRGTIPPLKTSNANLQVGTARRWQRGDALSIDDMIVISLQQDQPIAGATNGSATGRTVSTGTDVQTWGASPTVTAVRESTGDAYDVSSCKAFGVSLLCKAWVAYSADEYVIQVSDDHHAGGAVRAEMRLPASARDDMLPRIVSLPPPIQQADQKFWLFQFRVLANKQTKAKLANAGGQVVLGGIGPTAIAPPIVNCSSDPNDPCLLLFLLPYADLYQFQDRMEMRFFDDKEIPKGDVELYLLRSVISPTLSAVDADLRLHGTNLVFDSVRFGKGGPVAKLECADELRTDCQVIKAPKISTTTYVYLYQPANTGNPEQYYPLPLTSGSQTTYWTYSSPKPTEVAKTAKQPAKASVSTVKPVVPKPTSVNPTSSPTTSAPAPTASAPVPAASAPVPATTTQPKP